MNLEQQVCSLDLAKRLKELGVKQESAWYWKHNTESPHGSIDEWVLVHYDNEPYQVGSEYHVAALTVAELGEMFGESELPFYDDGEWKSAGYYDLPSGRQRLTADTEADARAKMLIYLLEQKLIQATT